MAANSVESKAPTAGVKSRSQENGIFMASWENWYHMLQLLNQPRLLSRGIGLEIKFYDDLARSEVL